MFVARGGRAGGRARGSSAVARAEPQGAAVVVPRPDLRIPLTLLGTSGAFAAAVSLIFPPQYRRSRYSLEEGVARAHGAKYSARLACEHLPRRSRPTAPSSREYRDRRYWGGKNKLT